MPGDVAETTAEVTEAVETESADSIMADVFPSMFGGSGGGDDDETVSSEKAEKAPGKAVAKASTKGDGKGDSGVSPGEQPAGADGKGGEALERIGDDSLFTDDALAKPAGIVAARQAIIDARKAATDQKRETHRTFVRTQRREESVKVREQEVTRQAAVLNAQVTRFNADVDMMKNGNAEEALQALGRLRGLSGAEAYEQLTQVMIANGKKPQVQRDPEMVELLKRQQQQIDALLGNHAQQTEEQARQAWRGNITQAVQTEQFPNLSEAFKDFGKSLVDRLDSVKREYYAANKRPIDDAALLAHFEQQLSGYVSKRQAEPAAQTPPATPPAPARKVPRNLPGKTVSTTRSTAEGGTRELSDDERFQELVNTPDILRQLGL